MFDGFSFFPDIDLYYQGDSTEAYDLVDELVDKNVDFIKFALCIHNPVSRKYSSFDTWVDPDGKHHQQKLYDTFEQRIISESKATNFLEYCKSKNVNLIASVYDSVSASLASKYCIALKVSSANITNFPLIEDISRNCENFIIDTGNSTDIDISNALEFVDKINPSMNILVQYSPTRPPKLSSTWNMWRIKEMQEKFSLPVGLSDHDNSNYQVIMSMALGVASVEKGVMSDRAWKEGVSDSAHCIPISQLDSYMHDMYLAKNGMQVNVEALHDLQSSKQIRNGLYAGVDIEAGTILEKKHLMSMMPENGIQASEIYNAIGSTVNKKIEKGEPVEWRDIGNK